MTFNLAGVSFASQRNRVVASMRPSGAVSFVPEPDNKYDSRAISVQKDGVHIGYVPKGYIQDCLIENEICGGIIDRYLYSENNGDSFNDEHNGILYSVTIRLDEEESFSPSGHSKYIRVTQFLKYFDPYGGGDGLIKWAFDQGTTFEEYQNALNSTAEIGTAMHSAIESYLQTGKRDGLPDGWDAFEKKYAPELCVSEQRIYDDSLSVSGQYDFLGYITIGGERVLAIVDWKSSKKPSIKHKMQCAFYAHNATWDNLSPTHALVVAFGAENKQRFSASCIDKEQIESMYVGMKHIKAAMDCIGVWTGDKEQTKSELESN